MNGKLPSMLIQAALIAGAVVLAIVVASKLVSPLPLTISQTTTAKQSSFNVTGKSTISTAPDKVMFSVGISQKGSDLKQAQDQANTVINAVTQKLQDLGVKPEDIKTQNYSISPMYNYQTGGQNITGYAVDISLEISMTDFSKLNSAIDAVTTAGANQVGGVEFVLSDAKQQDVKKRARAEAIADAERNALELAGLAGMRLGKVINVVEGNETPRPLPMMAANAMAPAGGGNPSTNIQPGSTTYTYTVTVSYETE